ncbi:hypothetical protein BJ138DRAFT_794011 [Hygrophoropsis aurantiaca]|uniref:Uncharacterized protein n=1 Tax=Hygrophoropsis aurantiaca TaxID=72124 RepID=A0ACB8AG09_9AGAM|nr:hypothetical protein BJ138DRAFT_794011 [Hygrophoropsis aurantiaca]
MAHFDAPSKHLSARPLRLQPSPSLPNLRSAPRDRRPRQMPHPSPRKSSFQLPVSPTEERVLNHSTKEGEDLNDRGHQPRGNHHYLTPPLTPSSSLKSDSSGPECPELCHENKPVPCVDLDLDDATPNRFLIIKNIPIDLLGDNIRYFVNSLATPSSECSAYESTLGSDNLTPNLSIQTIYHRSTDKRTIVVAFYDIRDADRVKHLVDTRNAGKMMEDKAKGKQRAMNGSDVSGRWEETLTCAYIAPKRLLELVGQSASSLMTETEGRFCVSVDHAAFANQDYSSNVNRSRTRFSVPVKMKSILMKHGDFKPIQLLEDSAYKQVGSRYPFLAYMCAPNLDRMLARYGVYLSATAFGAPIFLFHEQSF